MIPSDQIRLSDRSSAPSQARGPSNTASPPSSGAHPAPVLLHAEAEVRDLDSPLGVDQDVIALDVPVDASHVVQVPHCLKARLHKPRDLRLLHLKFLLGHGLQQARKGAPVHELHRDPQALVKHVALNILHHGLVPRRVHHRDLVL
eukprot:CAMPEP_0206224642 /NCGR_PEP_ID=MMETSP0047_2-20121206/7135_1 /ASSEMBLY_ACC=CAM_ASM_000192 /TAXON_ID=195065 /ORGANISM="Chroomonas mesostigmatica_cf, Strain CCMP1168" /LENGTH=145 /DNA_ID=CAMNT_0053647613 /DNA_START=589 /DNA_END=1028 /DNA_ORIENTATION=+